MSMDSAPRVAVMGGARTPFVKAATAFRKRTALELSALDLRGTELAVLSACGTGLGEERPGQGLVGLEAALLRAGVAGLVVSLWSVPDEPTRELMEAFYASMWAGAHVDKAESLRRAQLALLARRRHEGDERPLDWAAWILIGRP